MREVPLPVPQEQLADQADTAEAELQQHHPKKTALEDDLEGTFNDPAGAAQISYMSGIEADNCSQMSITRRHLVGCHNPPRFLILGSSRPKTKGGGV